MIAAHRFKIYGFLAGIIAAVSYGLNPLFALPLYGEGFSPDAVLFWRYMPAVLILAGMMKYEGTPFRLTARELAAVFVMGMLFSASSLFLFLSYEEMDAGIASTILFIYPLVTALIMGAFFHEKIRAATIFSLILALTGIGLLYRRADGSALSSAGIVFVLISAVSYALYLVGAGFPVLKKLPPSKLTFYVMFFGVTVYVIRLLLGIGGMGAFTLKAWVNIVLIAVVPTVISLVTTAVAVRRIGSTAASILGALEPLTAVFCGVMVFGERLTVRIVSGILLILLSVIIVILGGQRRKTVQ